MFNIQQHVSSFITKYIEKYTKCSNTESRKDIKLSIWNGNVTLDSLYLNVEAIENEYPLPFRLASGYIHELTIHVPWMKIGSESVTVTINTIEIVLKQLTTESDDTNRDHLLLTNDLMESTADQLSYTKSIIMKMFNNLNVICNNVIIKYADDNVVLTVTMKRLTLSPFTKQTDIEKVSMQKILQLNEITICLDKCNESGKIEYYNQPISFGASFVIHYSTNKWNKLQKGTNDLFEVFCEKINFEFNEHQLLLLSYLFGYLVAKDRQQPKVDDDEQNFDFKKKMKMSKNIEKMLEKVNENDVEEQQSWSSWFLDNFTLNLFEEIDDKIVTEVQAFGGRILQFSIYFDVIFVKLKFFEVKEKQSFLKNLKTLNTDIVELKLTSCYAEFIKYSKDWRNCSGGIGEIAIKSLGNCTCGLKEDRCETYVRAGEKNEMFVISNGYLNGEKHMETLSDRLEYRAKNFRLFELLKRSKAFVFDYFSYAIRTGDGLVDEKKSCCAILNAIEINLTAGFLHRVQSLVCVWKSFRKFLEFPRTFSNSNRINFESKNLLSIQMLNPVIVLHAAVQHPSFYPNENFVFSKTLIENTSISHLNLPKIVFEIDNVQFEYTKPLYCDLTGAAERVTGFSNAANLTMHKIVGRLELNETENSVFLSISNLNCSDCWTLSENGMVSVAKKIAKIDYLTMIGSKRIFYIVQSLLDRNFSASTANSFDILTDSSLLKPVKNKVLMELNLENIEVSNDKLSEHIDCFGCELGSIHVIVFEAIDDNFFHDPNYVILLTNGSATEKIFVLFAELEHLKDRRDLCLNRISLSVAELNVNLDPLFNQWLEYEPIIYEKSFETSVNSMCLFRNCGEPNLKIIATKKKKLDSLRKQSFNRKNSSVKSAQFFFESVHKSSEQDFISTLSPSVNNSETPTSKLDRNYFHDVLQLIFNSRNLQIDSLIKQVTVRHQTECRQTNAIEIFEMQLTEIKIETVQKKFTKNNGPNQMTFIANFKNFQLQTFHSSRQFYVCQPIDFFVQFFVDNSEKKINYHLDINQIVLYLSPFQLSTLLKTSKFIRKTIENYRNRYEMKLAKLNLPEIRKNSDFEFVEEEPTNDSLIESTGESIVLKNLEEIRNNDSSGLDDDGGNADESVADCTNRLQIKIWGQITITKIAIKMFTIEQNQPILASQQFESNIKILIDMEDLAISCTFRDTFMRFDLKIATIHSAHFTRKNPNDDWMLGKYSGIIIQRWIDRLVESDNASLIKSTIVFAFRNDVYRKWLKDITKNSDNSLLCEINIKLMPIELILSLNLLTQIQPIVRAIARLVEPETALTTTKSTAKSFLNNKLPLLNFVCKQLRLIVPVENADTIMFYLQNINISQKLTNLVQRSFILKSDLFAKAARSGLLTMPGSLLEDRQYLIRIETITSFSSDWTDILKLLETERNTLSDDFRLMDENPAAQWYRRLTDTNGLQFFPIAQKISNVTLIVAPAMYFNDQIVCGHIFELNIPTSVDFILNIRQLCLMKRLIDEIMAFGTTSTTTFTSTLLITNLNDFIPLEISVIMKEINITLYDQSTNDLLVMLSFMYPSLQVQSLNNVMEKNQVTFCDFEIKLSNRKLNEYNLWQTFDKNLFEIELSETKKFICDLSSNPNFAIFKWKKQFTELDFSILKSICFKLNRTILSILKKIQSLLAAANLFEGDVKKLEADRKFCKIQFETSQVVLRAECEQTKCQLQVSFEQFKFDNEHNHIEITDFLMHTIDTDQIPRILLNPTFLKISTNRTKSQNWLVNIKSPLLNLICNRIHVENLKLIRNEYFEIFATKSFSFANKSDSKLESRTTNDLCSKDFQMINFANANYDLPETNQLMFCLTNTADIELMWCYSQERLIESIDCLPLPVDQTSSVSIKCHLFYWCECNLVFRKYGTFEWSNIENKTKKFENKSRTISRARIWKLQLSNIGHDFDKNFIITGLKINSIFTKTEQLGHKVQFLWTTKIIEVLVNHELDTKSNEAFENFPIQNLNWKSIDLLKIRQKNSRLFLSFDWHENLLNLENSAELRINYRNFRNFKFEEIIEPTSFELSSSYEITRNTLNCELKSNSMKLHYNSTIYESLKSIRNLDTQMRFEMLSFKICNRTNQSIEFGQDETDERIELKAKYCWCYVWKDFAKSLKIHVKFPDNRKWSKAFSLEAHKGFCLPISDDATDTRSDQYRLIFVRIKEFAKNQLKIEFSGQLIVYNTFFGDLSLIVYSASTDLAPVRAKDNNIVEIDGKTGSICNRLPYKQLRMKVCNRNENLCSGQMNFERGQQAKFVKIPWKSKFRSVIVQIWHEKFDNGYASEQILVAILPMFVVRSYLPLVENLTVLMPDCNETMEWDVRKDKVGATLPLFCYGSIEHRQQLFYYPMFPSKTGETFFEIKYESIDFKKLAKKLTTNDLHLFDIIDDYEESIATKWFSDKYLKNLANIKWKFSKNYKPTCQFKLSSLSKFTNVLLIEYIPWWTIFNASFTDIYLFDENNSVLATVAFGEVIFPGKFEGNFRIGIGENNEHFYSTLIKFDKSAKDKSLIGSKSKIESLPSNGIILIPIVSDSFVYQILLNTFINVETQVLYFSSNYILNNQTKFNLNIIGLVLDRNDFYSLEDFPGDFFTQHALELKPSLNKTGTPLTKWLKLSELDLLNSSYYVLIKHTDDKHWTNCPIKLSRNERKKMSISLRTNDGKDAIAIAIYVELVNHQYYLTISYDCPQFLIENWTKTHLICEQTNQIDCRHFEWHCLIRSRSYAFYTIPKLNGVDDCQGTGTSASSSGNGQGRGTNITDSQQVFVNYTSGFKLQLRSVESALEKRSADGGKSSGISCEDSFEVNESIDTEILVNIAANRKVKVKIEKCEDLALLKMRISDDDADESMKLAMYQYLTKYEYRKTRLFQVNFVVLFEKLKLVLSLDRNGRQKPFSIFTFENFLMISNRKNMLNMYVQNFQIDNNLYYADSYDFPVIVHGKANDLTSETAVTDKCYANEIISESNISFLMQNAFVSWELQIFKRKISNMDLFLTELESSLRIKSVRIFLEEKFYTKLNELSYIFNIMELMRKNCQLETCNYDEPNRIPDTIVQLTANAQQPLIIRHFFIDQLEIYLSVHTSLQIYIAIDQTSLNFNRFQCQTILITPYNLGAYLSKHYLYNAIYSVPSIMGSFELAGNLTGFVRNVSNGLRDFLQMPYNGLRSGPVDFLYGLNDGSRSLLAHLSAGTLTSITNLADSVARNLDRLSLDTEHIENSEEQRRDRPENLVQGFSQGLTDFGIHMLGAVVGVAHHPLMTIFDRGPDLRGIAKGVGLGILGMVTKPLSGTAKLISLTGQGLLTGTGWSNLKALQYTETEQPLNRIEDDYSDRIDRILVDLSDSELITDSTLAKLLVMDGNAEEHVLLLNRRYFLIWNLMRRKLDVFECNDFERIESNADDQELRLVFASREYRDLNDYRQLMIAKYVRSTNSNFDINETCLTFKCTCTFRNEFDLFVRFLRMFMKRKLRSRFEIVFDKCNSNGDVSEEEMVLAASDKGKPQDRSETD